MAIQVTLYLPVCTFGSIHANRSAYSSAVTVFLAVQYGRLQCPFMGSVNIRTLNVCEVTTVSNLRPFLSAVLSVQTVDMTFCVFKSSLTQTSNSNNLVPELRPIYWFSIC